jgi:hypothetical protein
MPEAWEPSKKKAVLKIWEHYVDRKVLQYIVSLRRDGRFCKGNL